MDPFNFRPGTPNHNRKGVDFQNFNNFEKLSENVALILSNSIFKPLPTIKPPTITVGKLVVSRDKGLSLFTLIVDENWVVTAAHCVVGDEESGKFSVR